MSRKSAGLEKAVAESVFTTVKEQAPGVIDPDSPEQARTQVSSNIEVLCGSERLRSTSEYLRTPNITCPQTDDTREPHRASRRPNGCRLVAPFAA